MMSNDAMLVSVYMPTRNREALAAKAIASVLAQTHRNLELIVVDDGSTDGTPGLLAREAARDPRLRFFRNDTSRGAPYSRNLAITHARGEWITGLDDDDMFHPARIEAFLSCWQMLERCGTAFSCLFSQDIYEYEKTRETHTTTTRKPGNLEWRHLFEFNSIGNQIFTLTQRLRDAGMFDTGMPAWQDLDLFIRVLKAYGPAKLLDAPLYHLSLEDRPDRISRQKKERILQAYDRLSHKHPEASPREKQSLFLQVFGDLYGFRPGVGDLRRFATYGWDRINAKRFLKALLKAKSRR